MKCFLRLLRVLLLIPCPLSLPAAVASGSLAQQTAPPAQPSVPSSESVPTKPVEASVPASALKQWPAKLVTTEGNKSGAHVKLSTSDQSLTLQKGKDILLEISAASISEVGYDTSSHNRGWAWLRAVGGSGAHGRGEGMVIVAPLLAPAAILAPFKSSQHFVRILWADKGNPSEVLLEVGKQDYHAVLDELQRLSGKPWVDLPQARKKLLDEIEQAKDRSVPLDIDRKIVLNEAEMKPGRYQTVFLERPDNHGEVYFFNGTEIKPEHITAQAVVTMEPLNAETKGSGATYVAQHGVETISAIEFPGKKLVLVSGGLPVRVAKSARSFYGGGDKWATVIQTDYQGEAALRFHVIHNPFPHVCQEYLYVTRTRVASVIGPGSAQSSCGTFSVDRSEVKAVLQEETKWNRFLKVTVRGKNYPFQPIFEEANGKERVAIGGRTRDAAKDYSAFFVLAVTDFDTAVAQVQGEPNPPD